jgi:hypothetical protein
VGYESLVSLDDVADESIEERVVAAEAGTAVSLTVACCLRPKKLKSEVCYFFGFWAVYWSTMLAWFTDS